MPLSIQHADGSAAREFDAEGCSDAGLAFDGEQAVVGVDGGIHDRKPEAASTTVA